MDNQKAAPITLTPIESSQLAAIGFDHDTNTLAIRFHGKGDKPGTLYHYAGVSPEDWAAFRDADSKGSHFIRNIKPKVLEFPYTRVE